MKKLSHSGAAKYFKALHAALGTTFEHGSYGPTHTNIHSQRQYTTCPVTLYSGYMYAILAVIDISQ